MAGNLNYTTVGAMPQYSTNGQQYTTNGAQPTAAAGQSTDGGIDSLLGGLIQTGAGIYGSQNAAESQEHGNDYGIAAQHEAMGNINSIYSTQQQLGVGADTALARAQGLNGQPADYSGFENMPGYQFAIQQGTQAIQRGAAANGSAYTPNTLTSVGQYVTGTAMQDYNTYIQQLLGTAGLGQQANSALTDANLRTAGNISQMEINKGTAAAGGNTGIAGSIAGLAGNSGVVSGVGNILKGIGGLFKGSGGGGGTNGSGVYGGGGDTNADGSYNGGAFNGGAPLYDPNTGGYPGTAPGAGDGTPDWLNTDNSGGGGDMSTWGTGTDTPGF